MKLKFLKAAFTSLIIISSSIANAGIVNQWDVDFTALDDAGKFNVFYAQDTTAMSVDNDILTLEKNSWYYLNLSDAIGENSLDFSNTRLSFDFMTSGTPEIGGVQTSNTNSHSINETFNLIGTQDWGIDSYSYSDINQWVHFDINLDEYLSGDFSRIMFINDCDKCINSNTASFKNMTITQVPESSTIAIFALGLLGLVSRKMKKKA